MALQSTTPIATITLQSAISEVVFSGIPATYRDIILIYNGTVSSTAVPAIRLNSDTGSNYSFVSMLGYGSNQRLSQSGSDTLISLKANSGTSGAAYVGQMHLFDYSATDKHKTALTRLGSGQVSTADIAEAGARRWANNAAVTSITIFTSAGSMNAGSTISVYGKIA